MRRLGTSLLVVALGLVALSAHAQPSDSATRAARQLGNEGIELYEKGSFEAAEDRLGRAYAVIQVPTLGLWLARAEVKNGKLVEASEHLVQVTRMEVAPDAPAVLREAVAQAQAELTQLQPRIPTVTLRIAGAPASEVQITTDGAPLASALVGVPIALDPGTRVIEARQGDRVVTKRVDLAEGAKQDVVLDFGAIEPAVTTAPTPPPDAASTSVPHPEVDASGGARRAGPPLRTLGLAGMAVGGAVLATGGIFYVVAKGQEGDLEDNCTRDGRCAPEYEDEISNYDTKRTLSTVGLVAGSVLAAGGAVLFFVAPADHPAQGAHHVDHKPRAARTRPAVQPWVGLGHVGLRGRF